MIAAAGQDDSPVRPVDRRAGERRRRGRPKEFGSIVSVRLSTTLHDKLAAEASARGVDVADVIRERLNFVSQK